jgi:3-oxoacyl-[acyl-carrier protein] reductase
MQTNLAGKVVFITGASGGIGSGIAKAFAAEGARVALHYHKSRRKLEELARQLTARDVFLVGGDLSKESAARNAMARALQRFGRIDTLISNAGAWETNDVPLHEMTSRQWRKTLDGVLATTFYSVREFLRLVARQKTGNLVLIGSTAAIFGEAGHADYAAAKAALVYGLTRSLKNELVRLAPHTREYCGGRVNCVCPGWTVVPRLAAKLNQRKMVTKTVATMAMPQFARPEDIANAVVFLSSDTLARHITGQILVIAGGMEGRKLWEEGEINADWV